MSGVRPLHLCIRKFAASLLISTMRVVAGHAHGGGVIQLPGFSVKPTRASIC
jgi:hypothetical protein